METVTDFRSRELLITRAAVALQSAKEVEAQARKRRLEAEEHLVELIGAPEEGTVTEKAGTFKVTIKQPVNRKIDQKAAVRADELLGNKSPFKAKFELDLKRYRALADLSPDDFTIAAAAVTATPGKTSVMVEDIEGAA